jgi:hypothetical protein
MLPKQFGSLVWGGHFVGPVGDHLFVIEQLEDGVVGFPMLPVGQERMALSVMADEQVPFKAAIEFPPGV